MKWCWRALGVLVQSGAWVVACGQIGDEAGPASALTAEPPAMTADTPTMPATTAEDGGVDNAQTGSTDPPECYESCRVDIDDWRLPQGRAELVGAACTYGPSVSLYPVCECRMQLSLPEGEERPWDEWVDGPAEVVEYIGDLIGDCSVRGRSPASCLYCGIEFPGCNVDDVASCDAACAELADRYDADRREAFSIQSRVARCGAGTGTCEYVTEIEGRCYARDPREKQLPSFDCALSDEQILSYQDMRISPACEEPSVVPCETANDCPRGLACGGGLCGSCGSGCGDDQGRVIPCPGAPACAEGELCVLNACVPVANIENHLLDCPEGERLVLSGMDLTGGRGNAETRARCLPYRDFSL